MNVWFFFVFCIKSWHTPVFLIPIFEWNLSYVGQVYSFFLLTMSKLSTADCILLPT